MEIDWNREFVQAEVLRLIPNLSVKTLQNWKERGHLDWDYDEVDGAGVHTSRPGRGRPRLYTALDLVTLDFMVELARLGIAPALSAKLAWDVRQQALSIGERLAVTLQGWTGKTAIDVDETNLVGFSQARIEPLSDGQFSISFTHEPGRAAMRLRRAAFITVEADLLILFLLNRVVRLDAAKAELTRPLAVGEFGQ